MKNKVRIEKLFPTSIMRGNLPFTSRWNLKLLKEIEQFSADDKMGRDWSKVNYLSGYTSYASLSNMQWRSPLFSELHDTLQPHAIQFARHQGWNLKGLDLVMDTCWMNVMPKHAYHTLHLHPHSVLSGTYYVSTPPGSVALKLEDPRMPNYMNAPVRQNKGGELYYPVQPQVGAFVLFESWLRHEVPPNQSNTPRVSVSFNYSLVERE